MTQICDLAEVIWYLALMKIVFLGYQILNGTRSNWSVLLILTGEMAENEGNLSIRSAGHVFASPWPTYCPSKS